MTHSIDPAAQQPRVLVDFDGVIHRYSRGWADGTTYDPPIDGARGALANLSRHGYEVVIFSTRPADQIAAYLLEHQLGPFRITDRKEPAVALIDDRAIRFTDWASAIDELLRRYPSKTRPLPVRTPPPPPEIEAEMQAAGKAGDEARLKRAGAEYRAWLADQGARS